MAAAKIAAMFLNGMIGYKAAIAGLMKLGYDGKAADALLVPLALPA